MGTKPDAARAERALIRQPLSVDEESSSNIPAIYSARTLQVVGLTESRLKRFREKRKAGKLKRHSEKKRDKADGAGRTSKYTNPTTFKKCKGGAMISSPYLRSSLPSNTFVKPPRTKKDPKTGKTKKVLGTYPIRSNCRASLAGLGRALQFKQKKGGKGAFQADRALATKVLKRANQESRKERKGKGGETGKRGPGGHQFKLWGTRTSLTKQTRQETHRGPSGAAKRHKKYGKTTGREDKRLHTAKDEHGQEGNREVARSPMHAASRPDDKKSKGSKSRSSARSEGHAKRGMAAIGKSYKAKTRKERAKERSRKATGSRKRKKDQ